MSVQASPGEVITFYSYKGGTGRTMALANVGCLLARREAGPVLLIDWDLEAPGLHRFFRGVLGEAEQAGDAALDASPGLMDLLLELVERVPRDNRRPQVPDEADELLDGIDFGPYIIETALPGLRLMKAGCFDAGYPTRVNSFDWTSFHAASPWMMRALAERLAREHAYVLVDSRTGWTDASGVCTMLLPEKLVVVFTPGRQSLTGISDLVQRATRYRRESDDLRPLAVYPLPSRIDVTETELQRIWRFGDTSGDVVGYQPLFETILADAYDLPSCPLEDYFNEVQLQHVARHAYGEDVAVLLESQNPRLSLARSYVSFVEHLTDERLPWESEAVLPTGTRPFINRAAEQRLFLDMVEGRRRERVLAMADRPGAGKTAMLQRFSELCLTGLRHPVPCSLVRVGDLKDADPIVVVQQIAQDLTSRGVRLPLYEEVTRAYAVRDAAKIKYATSAAPPELGWGAEVEVKARTRVLDSFDRDLVDAAVQPIAILIDDIDDASRRVREWALGSLERWFNPAEQDRSRLVVAMTAGELTLFRTPSTELWIELHSLSAFTRGDVEEFLRTSGLAIDEKDVELLVGLIERGVPAAQIAAVADNVARTAHAL